MKCTNDVLQPNHRMLSYPFAIFAVKCNQNKEYSCNILTSNFFRPSFHYHYDGRYALSQHYRLFVSLISE